MPFSVTLKTLAVIYVLPWRHCLKNMLNEKFMFVKIDFIKFYRQYHKTEKKQTNKASGRKKKTKTLRQYNGYY